MRHRLLLLGLAALLGGCATLTPDYQRPELDVPAHYLHATDEGAAIGNLPWWELFNDPELEALIRTALAGNKDLKVALARIGEARQRVISTRANQYPFVNIQGTVGRGRESRELVPSADTASLYSVAGDLSFEVDLWGRLRRATEASRARLLSTEAAYRNVTISLVSNVATTYLLLRDLDQRLAISRRTAKARREHLAIIQARFEKGTVPEIDVNQAQIELASAEVAVTAFERRIASVENALQILLGNNPAPLRRQAGLARSILPPKVPAGLPSELIRRRPDVVAAEEALHAETALVGVFEALRYPSISLTGSLGLASKNLSDLTSGDSDSWNLAGNLLGPIFNSGQLKARAEAQRARAEQALYEYQAVLQNAFREVEDALAAVRTLREEHEARKRQVQAARNAARLSRARYDGGVTDYLEVLDSERSLFNAELAESATLQQYLNAIVRLYKALGGGWNPRQGATGQEVAGEAVASPPASGGGH